MSFGWLKHYMPRGIYGRAALILLLPVVVLQLVVTVLFAQRHFEGVTQQMTDTMLREISLVRAVQRAGGDPAAALAPLGIGVTTGGAALESGRLWYDYSGRVLMQRLADRLPGYLAADLRDTDVVRIAVDEMPEPLVLSFDRRRITAANPHQLFVYMTVFGFLMTVIAIIFLRNQLRPIRRLARAAEAFGKGRQMSLTPTGAVELRAAGHAFLDMRARIERHIEQRTLMLSGVSHDMRTPLTRLRLGLAMIDEEDAAPLLRDVDDMQDMLDEFLNFAKGMAEGEPERVDPREIVTEIVDNARREGKPVTLVQTGEGSGTVALREVAVRRAVENLINNAVRYGTRAVVTVSLTDKTLRIRVEDDGPGIPAEQRDRALRPFTRLDAARNQNAGGGVGLGLAIAADVARGHGGTLRLGASEDLGGLCADLVLGR
ncbi:HAMP domain-containing protein [Sulfitobacter albidus]|uniref:histidine kinase n=1 Tax=Sulfitobacter albidus TaxID=2829501 RepID=A0A975JFT3_9RHOB|nr:ATP-binding protein [Sulfitobacter albidus]QUJ77731.1 HAMP domain-containing protein [Sulfitobacter albidus]